MMKRILTLFVASCAMLTLWAQPKVPREWDFGVMGGANLSQYNFYPKATQDQYTGYTAGVAVRYIEEKYFGLEAELLLTKRGMRDRFDDDHQQYSFDRSLTYIEVPVNAHIYFNLGKRNEIAVDLGPKIGFFVGDATKSSLDASFEAYAASFRHGFLHHTLDISRKVDYGIQAGLGYEFKFSPELSFQLMGRYYYGLGNLFPDKKGETFEESSNRSIQIVGTLWFRHKVRLPYQKTR